MADPVNTAEIEDVLSSIRRLVSDEERGPRAGSRKGAARDAAGQAEDKLVLTPAHRVEEDRAEEDWAEEDWAVDGRAEEATEAVEDWAGEDWAEEDRDENGGECESAEAEASADVAPSPDRHGAWHLDRVEDAELITTPQAPENEAAAEADDRSDAPTGDDAEEFAAQDQAPEAETLKNREPASNGIDLEELEARVAGFEAAVAAQEDEWEPDGSDGDELVSDPATALPWRDDRDDEEAARVQEAPEEPEAETPAEVQAGDDGTRTDEEPADGAEDAREWYDDEAIVDEEALRDLVIEIVRQELQGELGERITRNVRKLVRREIHRALLSQGLE